MEKINAHYESKTEFAEKCNLCGSDIKFIREGSFGNPVSDITECDCLKIEHENGVELMGNNLKFGHTRILKEIN